MRSNRFIPFVLPWVWLLQWNCHTFTAYMAAPCHPLSNVLEMNMFPAGLPAPWGRLRYTTKVSPDSKISPWKHSSVGCQCFQFGSERRAHVMHLFKTDKHKPECHLMFLCLWDNYFHFFQFVKEKEMQLVSSSSSPPHPRKCWWISISMVLRIVQIFFTSVPFSKTQKDYRVIVLQAIWCLCF